VSLALHIAPYILLSVLYMAAQIKRPAGFSSSSGPKDSCCR